MSLRELSENVKLAREYALLGNYSSASILYQGLLEQIKKYQYTVKDSSFQQRWQQVNVALITNLIITMRMFCMPFLCCLCLFSQLWQEISEESRQVQDIMWTLENFQLDTTPAKPTNHDDCEIRPVQVEPRYCSWLFFQFFA